MPYTQLSDDERRQLRAFFGVYDRHRAVITHEVRNAAAEIESLRSFLHIHTPQERAERDEETARLQRAAMLEGRWEEYLLALRAEGRAYAQMGVPFSGWYSILPAFRRSVVTRLVDTFTEPAVLADSVLGMDRFLDIAMMTIGESYLSASLEQLESQQRRERSIVDACPAAVLTTDEAGTVQSWNPAAERLLGYRASEAVGQPMAALGIPPMLGDVPGQLGDSGSAPAPRSVLESQGTRRDGTEFTAEVSVLWLRHEPPPVLVAFIHDITARKEAESQRSRAAAVDAVNEELEAFSYAAAHDLRSPLRAVQNLAGWLSEDLGDDLPAASVRHLHLLGRRVAQMDRLLGGLLDYARAGRFDQAQEEVDVRYLVEEIAELLRAAESATVVASDGLPRFQTCRVPLEQVLRNLIGNAIKHHDRAEGTVEVSCRDVGAFYEITVADDGPGVPETARERIFRIFEKLDASNDVGAGIGLALVQRQVRIAGGSIHLEGRGERGSAFRFTWPKRWPRDVAP